MRWRSPSKPRCRFAKLVSDRHRVRRSLTGQKETDAHHFRDERVDYSAQF